MVPARVPRNRLLPAPALTPVRVASLLLGLALAGCQEAELPVDPEAEPRFTAIAIDVATAEPHPSFSWDPGLQDYNIEAQFQVGPGHRLLNLIAELFIIAYSGSESTTLLYTATPLDNDVGRIDFSGTVNVLACDSVSVVVYLTDAADLLSFISVDSYEADITGSALSC